MSAYDIETILKKWERGTLTTEQAIGQILLMLQNHSRRLGNLELRQEEIRRWRNTKK